MAHDKHRAADIRQRQIHFPFGVVKDAKLNRLIGELMRVGIGVVLLDAEKNDETLADLANDLSLDGDAGPRNALDDCPHIVLDSSSGKPFSARIRSTSASICSITA